MNRAGTDSSAAVIVNPDAGQRLDFEHIEDPAPMNQRDEVHL